MTTKTAARTVHEIAEATGTATRTGARIRVHVLTPGWGSSGYYPQAVVEAAGKAGVFAAGTHMYLDHPGLAEQDDRPVRSVRDLAAVLDTTARWDPSVGALVAEARVLSPYQGTLAEMAPDIGVSIRGTAMGEYGTAEGRDGLIFTQLVEAISVDFVTKAGRGGKIVDVLESARQAPVVAAVARGVAEATAGEVRDALQAAVRKGYATDSAYAYVRDFDDATVWYSVDSAEAEAMWQDGYTLDANDAAVLTGTPIQVRPVTTYVPVTPTDTTATVEHRNVPVDPAGRPHPSHSQEEHMAQIQVDEAQYAVVTEAAGRVPELERLLDEATRAKTQAEEDARAAQRNAAAVSAIAESGHHFTNMERRGLLASLPVTADGAFDAATFAATLTEAVAESAAHAGAGQVRGFGATTTTDTTVTEAAVADQIAALRGRKGA